MIEELANGGPVRSTASTSASVGAGAAEIPLVCRRLGPRVLAVAGRVADGDHHPARRSRDHRVDRRPGPSGSREAGRDPAAIKVMACAPAHVSVAWRTRASRCARSRPWSRTTSSMCRSASPATPPARRLRRADEAGELRLLRAPPRRRRARKQIADETCERFCVLGTPERHVEKLRRLEAAGVDQWNIFLMTSGQEETLEVYGREIVPALRWREAARPRRVGRVTRARRRRMLRGATRPAAGLGRRAEDAGDEKQHGLVKGPGIGATPTAPAHRSEPRNLPSRRTSLTALSVRLKDTRMPPRGSDHRHGHALDGVVHVAAKIPDGLHRLLVPRVVACAATELMHARHGVPADRPPLPRPVGVDVALDGGCTPSLSPSAESRRLRSRRARTRRGRRSRTARLPVAARASCTRDRRQDHSERGSMRETGSPGRPPRYGRGTRTRGSSPRTARR